VEVEDDEGGEEAEVPVKVIGSEEMGPTTKGGRKEESEEVCEAGPDVEEAAVANTVVGVSAVETA